MTRFAQWILVSVMALAIAPAAWAEPESSPAAGRSTASTVDELIQDLDSGDFKVREQATRALVERGIAAVEAVAEAATGESLEVTSRSIEILRQGMQSDDADTAAAAKAALDRLAKSDHRNAARRASAIVNPKPEPMPEPAAPFQRMIRIQNVQIGGGGARIQVQNNNGNKTIDVEEGGRKIHIETSAKGPIKMKITEKVEGKEKTTEYEAKDFNELKKKSPEAAELAKKYIDQGIGGAIQINGARIQIQAQALPQAIPQALPAPRRAMIVPQKALDQLEEANRRIDESLERAKKLAEDNPDFKSLVDELEKARQELKEARQQFGR